MRNVLIAFGSPSDYDSFFDPNFQRLDDTNYFLSIASAHRTPEMVEDHARAVKYDAVVAGAGMKNALVDAYFRHCPEAVHIALPIEDSRTGGLSSILSSSEMPPGCPVAMSRMNDMNAAVAFANYALGKFNAVNMSHDNGGDSKKAFDKAVKTLKELGIEIAETSRDSAINIVAYDGAYVLDSFDRAVACFASPLRSDETLHNFLSSLKFYPNVVHTGIADGANLALYAAKIIGRSNPDVKACLAERFEKGLRKYDDFKELKQV